METELIQPLIHFSLKPGYFSVNLAIILDEIAVDIDKSGGGKEKKVLFSNGDLPRGNKLVGFCVDPGGQL